MGKYASEMVNLMKSWIGKKEADKTHQEIIDIYNAHRPLARGYKVKYNDAWCATTISAASIKLGYTDIIPTECGCGQMIELCKKLGIWVENDAHVPSPGDIIFYDWNDSGVGDNTGWPEHVGLVEKVVNNKITVIEGNYNDSVQRRNISVNGKNIRGFAVPKYDVEPEQKVETTPVQTTTTTKPAQAATTAKPVSKVNQKVLRWQKAAQADGFSFPKYGADGQWGAECEAVATKAIVKKRLTYTYRNLTKIVQEAVGVSADGKCGKNTRAAIIVYQKKHGLTADGCVGLKTWKKILGV